MQSNIIITPVRRALSFRGLRHKVLDVPLSISDPGGPGIPVVCSHAAGHGSRDFEALRNRMGSEIRLIAFDWPEHGASGCDPVLPNVARYAELLLGVLDALALKRVVLLGCSIGGAASLRLAATHPERVRALVLCNAGGLARSNWLVGVFTRAMAAAYRAGVRDAWWFPYFFAAQYRLLLRGSEARRQRERIVAAGKEHAPILSQLWTSFGTDENDVRAHIGQVRCPTWLAWARSDPYNSHHLVARSLRQFDGKLSLFRGGHAPFLEQPDLFAAGLMDFFHSTGIGACSAGGGPSDASELRELS